MSFIIAHTVHVYILCAFRYNEYIMGRYIQQNESRSELQQRIAADLRAKAAAKSKQDGNPNSGADAPDGVDDSAYIEGTKNTTSLALVWLILFFAAIGVFVYFIIQVNKQ